MGVIRIDRQDRRVELPVGETVNQQKTINANDNVASEDFALAA